MNTKYQQFRDLLLDVGIKPANFVFVGLIGAAVILSIPSLERHQARTNLVRDEIKQRQDVADKLKRQLQHEQQQSIIANKRYKSCLPVVGSQYSNGTHYFTGLREGDKPKDKITGKLLPSGTVICDAHGNTAVISKDGTARYFAFTGNRDLIQKRLQRFRGSQYTQPITD